MSAMDPDVPPPPPAPGAAASPPPLPAPPPMPSAAPAAAAEEPADRAMLHTTEVTRTYPCRACGGELHFDITRQLLRCPHCGNEAAIDVSHLEAPRERDYRSAVAALRANAASHGGQAVAGDKEIVCQNCGGHTTFTGTLTADRCPYCTTPIQRDDVHDAPERLPVDGILPFAVDEQAATKAIEAWIGSRWFAPNEFKRYHRTGSFASVYTAYFTYDAEAHTSYRGQRGDHYTVTVGSGEDRRTETRTRWTDVSGNVTDRFDDLAVYANEGLDRSHVEHLEPWPTHQAQPFSPEFVAGHLCRTYDHDVEACFVIAEARMAEAIRDTIERDIGGDEQRVTDMQTSYPALAYKHLLLPVWLLTVIFEGKPYQVLINGMTGEVQGERPYSKAKIAAAVVAALVVVVLLVVLTR